MTVLVTVLGTVFAVGWAAFWIYWLVAAFSTKRSHIMWARELGIRAALVVIVIVLTRLGVFRHPSLSTDAWRASLGLILFGAGLALRDLGPPPHRT